MTRSILLIFILVVSTWPAVKTARNVSAAERQSALKSILHSTHASFGEFDNAAALAPFLDRLSKLTPATAIHILHLGDSHTASDDWANAMRKRLQARFGAGGPGFALAGYPFRGYRRFDVAGSSSSGWHTAGTLAAPQAAPGDGRNGLGGVSLSSNSPDQTITLTADAEFIRVFYLRQPGGGSVQLSDDDMPVATIQTDGESGAAYYTHAAQPGTHHYTLRTLESAPVRIFGWVAERPAGLTYEAAGINGIQAPALLDWDPAILADQLAQRDPALIVLAYGTNEAVNAGWTAEGYSKQFSRVLERFRQAAPGASILVIGPPDALFRARAGRFTTAHLSSVIEVQRAVAVRQGCAFWDWRARMGGAGAGREWLRAGLAQPDRLHLTSAGYGLVGELLTGDLMEQYRRFQAAKAE